MVATPGLLHRLTGTEARRLLAELLSEELGYSVTPEQVRRLIERRWSRLSLLAHAAHDDYEEPMTAERAARLDPFNPFNTPRTL